MFFAAIGGDMVSGRCARVLVVDDEEVNSAVVTAYLAPEFEVLRSVDGTLALSMISEERPDAILLDVSMPGLDGYEVCSRIKADPATADIPVLFFTALDQDEAVCFEVGADDYVPKPLSVPVLLARLRMQLRLRSALTRVDHLQGMLGVADREREQLERRQEKLIELLRKRTAEKARRLVAPRTTTTA
jgi:putative two-component system response regulator